MSRAANGTRTLAPMMCKTCGTVKMVRACLVAVRKYCSTKCHTNRGREKGSKNRVQKATNAIACRRCGKIEHVNDSIAKKRKFCSAQCADTRFKKQPPRPRNLPFSQPCKPSRNVLYNLVHIQRETRQQTGERFGVSGRTIWRWCSEYEIPEIAPIVPVSAEKLRHLYIDLDFSMGDIGRLYSVSASIVKRLLTDYDIPPKLAGWTRRQYKGIDGHLLRSIYEQRVCDWLFAHSIEHTCEPRLLNTKYRADFLAKGFYVEIWGVTGNAIYTARKQKKLALYAEYKLPLISLSHSRFSRNTWERPLTVLLEAAALSA